MAEPIKESKCFNEIEYKGLQDLILDLTKDKPNQEDIAKKADMTMEVVMKMLTDGGQYKKGNSRTWVDILVASAFCYYAYFDKDNEVSSLYKVRDYIVSHEDNEGIVDGCTPNVLEALCETVECSRGCRTKVRKCMPAPNSPQQVLGDVIWYTEKFPVVNG